MSIIDLKKLREWLKHRPFVVLRFQYSFLQDLRAKLRGTERFTIALPHDNLRGVKLPTLCLVEFVERKGCQCFVGVVGSKSAITTFESRLSVMRLKRLEIPSLESLAKHIKRRTVRTVLKRKLAWRQTVTVLTPKTGLEVLEYLLSDPIHRIEIESAAVHLPKFRTVTKPEWEQEDAIKTALAAFGLTKDAIPEEIKFGAGAQTALRNWETRALEDYVITYDAQNIPDFVKDHQDLTGRAIFRRGAEFLTIYTANHGPLEKMLGVDLIYVNQTVGSIVMIQYKMLEDYQNPESSQLEWIFRPNRQLGREINRMKIPALKGKPDDYRLHGSPFFFKFVQRRGDGEEHKSFILSLEHLNWLLNSPHGKGPRGGIRFGYEALEGIYLRETDLMGLIRSGYIGTHRQETKALKPLISSVAQGDRALVLAWQQLTISR